jgi:hypothetical protein
MVIVPRAAGCLPVSRDRKANKRPRSVGASNRSVGGPGLPCTDKATRGRFAVKFSSLLFIRRQGVAAVFIAWLHSGSRMARTARSNFSIGVGRFVGPYCYVYLRHAPFARRPPASLFSSRS